MDSFAQLFTYVKMSAGKWPTVHCLGVTHSVADHWQPNIARWHVGKYFKCGCEYFCTDGFWCICVVPRFRQFCEQFVFENFVSLNCLYVLICTLLSLCDFCSERR